jgi:hypothetical protein
MSIDKNSESWEEVNAFIENESRSILSKLVLKTTSELETQYLRGAYAILNQLKQLPDKKVIPLVEIDNYT